MFVIACLLTALGVAAKVGFGSPEAALAYLRGEPISVQPNLVDVGAGALGDARETTVQLVNRTDRPVRLIGGTSDASCSVTADLPLTIPANDSRSISLKIGFGPGVGTFTREARLIADYGDGLGVVTLRVTGRIKPPMFP